MRRHVVRARICIGVFVCLLLASPAFAQKTNLPGELTKSKPDLTVIRTQLELALKQAQTSLVRFQEVGPHGSLDPAIQSAENAYVLVRSAREGLEDYLAPRTRAGKPPDPMKKLAQKKMTEAWNAARTPGEFKSWAMPRERYFEKCTTALNRAVGALEQALALLP